VEEDSSLALGMTCRGFRKREGDSSLVTFARLRCPKRSEWHDSLGIAGGDGAECRRHSAPSPHYPL